VYRVVTERVPLPPRRSVRDILMITSVWVSDCYGSMCKRQRPDIKYAFANGLACTKHGRVCELAETWFQPRRYHVKCHKVMYPCSLMCMYF
jgi:hypothetical protein